MDITPSIPDINRAITVFLHRYPGKNIDEFNREFGDDASATLEKVREILGEAMRVDVDWTGRTLSEGGAYVKEVMAERHPYLAEESLGAIGRYYTYLMR